MISYSLYVACPQRTQTWSPACVPSASASQSPHDHSSGQSCTSMLLYTHQPSAGNATAGGKYPKPCKYTGQSALVYCYEDQIRLGASSSCFTQRTHSLRPSMLHILYVHVWIWKHISSSSSSVNSLNDHVLYFFFSFWCPSKLRLLTFDLLYWAVDNFPFIFPNSAISPLLWSGC